MSPDQLGTSTTLSGHLLVPQGHHRCDEHSGEESGEVMMIRS